METQPFRIPLATLHLYQQSISQQFYGKRLAKFLPVLSTPAEIEPHLRSLLHFVILQQPLPPLTPHGYPIAVSAITSLLQTQLPEFTPAQTLQIATEIIAHLKATLQLRPLTLDGFTLNFNPLDEDELLIIPLTSS